MPFITGTKGLGWGWGPGAKWGHGMEWGRGKKEEVGGGGVQGRNQTPSTGLRHPSFNHMAKSGGYGLGWEVCRRGVVGWLGVEPEGWAGCMGVAGQTTR